MLMLKWKERNKRSNAALLINRDTEPTLRFTFFPTTNPVSPISVIFHFVFVLTVNFSCVQYLPRFFFSAAEREFYILFCWYFWEHFETGRITNARSSRLSYSTLQQCHRHAIGPTPHPHYRHALNDSSLTRFGYHAITVRSLFSCYLPAK